MRYPALRHRDFTLLWAGLIVSNVGTWMQNVALAWLIYRLTGKDPLYLGWLGLAFAVPMVALPPFGGVIADRVNRVRLLYFTQTAALLLAAALAALTWTGAIRPWHILATTFLGALLLAFDNPARQSLIPDLVPRATLQNALSLNAATFTGAALLGPALAGALLEKVGAGWLCMFNAASFGAVLFALAAMRSPPMHAHANPAWRDALFGGFVYAFRERWVLALLTLSAVSALFARSYQPLLPAFSDQVFGAGARGYGLLLAGGGGGALFGAIALSSLGDLRSKERVMVFSGLALAVTLFAFTRVQTLRSGIALVTLAGVASTVFTTMIATAIQLRVPGPLRGRVISLYVSSLIGLPSLGALGIAAMAKKVGAPNAVAAGTLVFAVWQLIAAPALLRRQNDP